MLKISVLVPTFHRPDDLRRCLTALSRQRRPADQVVVVVREDDLPTRQVVAALGALQLPLTVIMVRQPGVIHAMACGLTAVPGDIVAITDDDAAPHVDWLERIERVFLAAPKVGGVGGRDVIGGRALDPTQLRSAVGRVQWFGRVIGNHHLGCGPPRPVHVLKGVNCAYRVDAIRQVGFDLRLRGIGAQNHFELDIGLGLVQRGWTLIYDPGILVDHFPAPRHDYDQRNQFNPLALTNEVHNETMVLLRHLPPLRRAVYVAWFLACGTRAYPGLLCWLVGLSGGASNSTRRLVATLRGRWLAALSSVKVRSAWLADPLTPLTSR